MSPKRAKAGPYANLRRGDEPAIHLGVKDGNLVTALCGRPWKRIGGGVTAIEADVTCGHCIRKGIRGKGLVGGALADLAAPAAKTEKPKRAAKPADPHRDWAFRVEEEHRRKQTLSNFATFLVYDDARSPLGVPIAAFREETDASAFAACTCRKPHAEPEIPNEKD